jgi:hypothetical protein
VDIKTRKRRKREQKIVSQDPTRRMSISTVPMNPQKISPRVQPMTAAIVDTAPIEFAV